MVFVKDSSPLQRRTMQRLTGFAVTKLGIHGLCAHFVANPAAKARRPEH
jgi:hypothetical protein